MCVLCHANVKTNASEYEGRELGEGNECEKRTCFETSTTC